MNVEERLLKATVISTLIYKIERHIEHSTNMIITEEKIRKDLSLMNKGLA